MRDIRRDRGGPAASHGLTRRDRHRIARALAAARSASLYRRLEAVLLVAEGGAVSEAARRVRVASRSVQRWVARYLRARDPDALADRSRPGRPRVAAALTPARLAAVLATDPRTLGYAATTWTAPLLAHHLRSLGAHRPGGLPAALALSERTLRRRLHEHRYRWKRPRYVYHARAAHVAQKKGR
jgi:transposase